MEAPATTAAAAAAAAPPPNLSNIARTFTKLLRRKRSSATAAASSVAGDYDDNLDNSINSIDKIKLSANLANYSLEAFFKNAEKAPPPQSQPPVAAAAPATAESLIANLFARVSAVKAAYAQLQLAQSPYDPDTIQSADAAVVAELKRLSELKRCYLKDPAAAAPPPPLAAQAEEQRHLLKTYQITARKLEAELRAKDDEARTLGDRLAASEKECRALEARLHPGRTLAALDDLHLSGLNPTHFLTAVRHTVKSIRSFSRSMTNAMQSAGWDLAAAAAAVHPGVPIRRPAHTVFALQSYIAMKMFANFHRRDFNLSFLEDREFYDRRRFFEEFTELKAAPARVFLDERNARWAGLGKFFRAKYLSLVHAKMEASFFGRLEQRGIVSAGPGFPESRWFLDFAEMARRVWLLHCLFFAFDEDCGGGGGGGEDGEEAGSIFQVRSGARFSEVYMESVTDDNDIAAVAVRSVGFTVVPGFRVGRTVIQCRVYLSDPVRRL